MKKQPPVGLVVEGDASNSAILNLPGIGPNVSLVKSSSLRAARRFSNAFDLGDAVENYEDLQPCRLILIKVPDEELPRILGEIRSALEGLTLPHLAICETWISTEMVSNVEAIAAKLATATSIPSPLNRWFIAEGDATAVRQLRRILEDCEGKVLPIERGTKSLYFAAEVLTTAAPLQMLLIAKGLLREAGLSGNVLSSVAEQLFAKMYRNFKAGHRIAIAGPMAACTEQVAWRHLSEAQKFSPELARLLNEYVPHMTG